MLAFWWDLREIELIVMEASYSVVCVWLMRAHKHNLLESDPRVKIVFELLPNLEKT